MLHHIPFLTLTCLLLKNNNRIYAVYLLIVEVYRRLFQQVQFSFFFLFFFCFLIFWAVPLFAINQLFPNADCGEQTSTAIKNKIIFKLHFMSSRS
ncbi:hypothetical protein EVA_04376 [gut metagenome]|uniref:Transmembrane protein n=1 Tax=gut metagenome TaxID=749906 RepID=J9D4B9_9ZZZZ